MIQTLKNSFIQATLGSIIWIVAISSISNMDKIIPFHFIWNILLIGVLYGFVFGLVYPYLWNYSTFKAATNIMICTVAISIIMFLGVWLYSSDMFNFIRPYWVIIIPVTLIGHIIGFYVYSNYQNKQLKRELNELI